MNKFTDREVEILKLILTHSEQFELAVLTKDDKKTDYQREILALFDKLAAFTY